MTEIIEIKYDFDEPCTVKEKPEYQVTNVVYGEIKEEPAYLQDFNGNYIIKADGIWVRADDFFECLDGLMKAGRGLPIGTRRTWSGQEWEKTGMGWRPVSKDKHGRSDEELHERSKKQMPQRFDFSKISGKDLLDYAKDTSEMNLRRFLDHDGTTKDGTKVSEVAREGIKWHEGQKRTGVKEEKAGGGGKGPPKSATEKEIENLDKNIKTKDSISADLEHYIKNIKDDETKYALTLYKDAVDIFSGQGEEDLRLQIQRVSDYFGFADDEDTQKFFGDGAILGMNFGYNNDGVEFDANGAVKNIRGVTVLMEQAINMLEFTEKAEQDRGDARSLFPEGGNYQKMMFEQSDKYRAIYMANINLSPFEEKGTGIGTNIFANQIVSFGNRGVEEFYFEASNSDTTNGGTTWALFGAEAYPKAIEISIVPHAEIILDALNGAIKENEYLEDFEQIPEEEIKKYKNEAKEIEKWLKQNKKTLQGENGLLSSDVGRDIWRTYFTGNREYGGNMMFFDLRENSPSMIAFNKRIGKMDQDKFPTVKIKNGKYYR